MIRTLLNVVCLLCISGADRAGDEVEAVRRDRIAEYRTVLIEIATPRPTTKPAQGLPKGLGDATDAWT